MLDLADRDDAGYETAYTAAYGALNDYPMTGDVRERFADAVAARTAGARQVHGQRWMLRLAQNEENRDYLRQDLTAESVEMSIPRRAVDAAVQAAVRSLWEN